MYRSLPQRTMTLIVGVLAIFAAGCSGDTATVIDNEAAVEAPAAATEVPTPDDEVVATVEPVDPSPTATEEPAPTAEPTLVETTGDTSAATSDGSIDRATLVGELEQAMDTWLAASTAPGVSLSIRLPGEEPINIARGVSDLATGELVTVDDYFRIASITKSMTAATALQLVDEGVIELDAPVTNYLGSDWLGTHPSAAEITVAQLMNHTNGLIEYAFDIGFYSESIRRLDTPYEPEEILEFLSRKDPLFAPGEKYQYETGGFVALGLIIEKVTGNSAAAEMRARILEPAGAEHIFLTPEEFPPESVVNGYVRGELFLAFNLLDRDAFEGTMIGSDPVIDVLSGEQAVLQSAGWTGGGNEARLESVSAVWKAMFDGTILSPAAIESMTTTVFDSNYGLGLSVTEEQGTTVYAHGGGVPGFRSQAGYLPDYDISYAFSANLIPLPDGTDVSTLTEVILPLAVLATAQS